MIDQVKRRIAEIEARSSELDDKSHCDGDDAGCDEGNPDEDEARLEVSSEGTSCNYGQQWSLPLYWGWVTVHRMVTGWWCESGAVILEQTPAR